MSIEHKERAEVSEAPQAGRRHKRAFIAAAVALPVVVGVGVGTAVALSGGAGGNAGASASERARHLAITDDVCSALQGLIGHSIAVGDKTAVVTRVGCSDPNTIDEQANVFGGEHGGKPFDLSVNVFGDAESSAEPMAQATADGYTEYLGGFSVASQKQMYGSVTPTTVNGIPAFYETDGQTEGQSYGDAVLMSDGNDDLSVQVIGSPVPSDELMAIVGAVESKVFVPATS